MAFSGPVNQLMSNLLLVNAMDSVLLLPQCHRLVASALVLCPQHLHECTSCNQSRATTAVLAATHTRSPWLVRCTRRVASAAHNTSEYGSTRSPSAHCRVRASDTDMHAYKRTQWCSVDVPAPLAVSWHAALPLERHRRPVSCLVLPSPSLARPFSLPRDSCDLPLRLCAPFSAGCHSVTKQQRQTSGHHACV